MAAPIGTSGQKSKDHQSRKNGHMAEVNAERRKLANDTPERKIAQLRYRLDSIEGSVKAGRQRHEDVEADVKRLRSQLEALEAQS
jgi:chromosome segregation ATPase